MTTQGVFATSYRWGRCVRTPPAGT